MGDYKDLKWEGRLNRVLYRETRHSDEARHELVSPQGNVEVSRLDILLNRGGGYMPEFVGNVPDEYVGKQVIFTDDLQTEEGVRTHTQRLSAEGLDPLVASTSWKV